MLSPNTDTQWSSSAQRVGKGTAPAGFEGVADRLSRCSSEKWHFLYTIWNGLSCLPATPGPAPAWHQHSHVRPMVLQPCSPRQSPTHPHGSSAQPKPQRIKVIGHLWYKGGATAWGRDMGTGTGLCLAHLSCHITCSTAVTCLGACASTGGSQEKERRCPACMWS